MAKYYYFGATLHSLRFDSPLPLSLNEFLERAGRYLKPDDLAIIESARLRIPEGDDLSAVSGKSAVLTRYYRWDNALRNELARLRAGRLKVQGDKFLRPGEPEWEAARAALAAFQADDPLQGELIIEKDRWAFLESLAANRFFDTEFLCVYALMLQALERRASFRADAGEEGYNTVYKSILESAELRDQTEVNL